MKIAALQKHIEVLYRAGCRHSLMLIGPPGIGKSDSARNAAENLGIEHRAWQATIEDPLELPGLPTVKGTPGNPQEAIRVPFEDKVPSKGKGILTIDELNSASSLTQCSLYSLVWDRKLGGCKLGSDWMIIGTGNGDKDRAVTQRIPTPLVSRMETIHVEPDVDSWMTWAAVNGCHDVVRAFIKTMPHLFVNFKPEIPGPFACPRTWKMVSDVMLAYGKQEPPFESLAGWVGEGPATEFSKYNLMALDMIDPEEIIKAPKTAKVPEAPGQLYALTTALAGRANYSNFSAMIIYINRIPVEFAVYFASSARDVERGRLARMGEEERKKIRKLQEVKEFREWCLRHHQLITVD